MNWEFFWAVLTAGLTVVLISGYFLFGMLKRIAGLKNLLLRQTLADFLFYRNSIKGFVRMESKGADPDRVNALRRQFRENFTAESEWDEILKMNEAFRQREARRARKFGGDE